MDEGLIIVIAFIKFVIIVTFVYLLCKWCCKKRDIYDGSKVYALFKYKT